MSLQADWLTASADHARMRTDEGALRAAEHAERALRRAWIENTLRLLKAWAAGRGEFLIEDFRAAGVAEEPPEPRAFGHIAKIAAARGILVHVGFRRADTSHGAFKQTWRLA